MRISGTVINAMLDDTFKASDTTYALKLWFGGEVYSDPETITFETAASGVTELTASKAFTILAGTTVSGVLAQNSTLTITLINETIADEVYTVDGTFTVNNITVTLSAA